MKITITTAAGAEVVIDGTPDELSTTEVVSQLYTQALKAGEEIKVEYEEQEDEEGEPQEAPVVLRAATTRGALPPAPASSSHADDCECSKCLPSVTQLFGNIAKTFIETFGGEDYVIKVPGRHLPVLEYLVALRKDKKATRAAVIAKALEEDVEAVSSSLQYLRLHGLAYHGGDIGAEPLSLGNNSHVWTATTKAIYCPLVAA